MPQFGLIGLRTLSRLPWAPPGVFCCRYRSSYLLVKRPGRGDDLSPHSSPSVPAGMSSRRFTFTFISAVATGLTDRGLNPCGSEIFLTRPDRPRGPSSLLHKGYRIFSVGKAAGAWRWPPTPSIAEEEYLLLPYSPSGPSWPVLGWTLFSAVNICWWLKAT